jgi:abhydrolase domain-containing protein 12
MFVHSNDDFDISIAHSQTLYEALLESHLPPIPYNEEDIRSKKAPFAEMMDAIKRVNTERAGIREQVETVLDLGNVGKVMSFTRPQLQGGRSATFFKTNFGGHNMIIVQETVMDVVRDTLDL